MDKPETKPSQIGGEVPNQDNSPIQGDPSHPGTEGPNREIRARGYAKQVKPCKRVRKSSGNVVRSKGSNDLAIFKRLSNVLYNRWKTINSKEMSLLSGLALCLAMKQKRTIAKDDLLRWMGYKMKLAKAKQVRWLENLCDNGYLLRVQFDEIGHGYGLTEYGQAFINDLDKEYDKARQWVEDQNRFTDIVIYLDRVKEQLHPRQRALFTPAQIEQLKAIGKY